MFFTIFLIVFFIFLNGFFVLSEYALVSLRKTRVEELVTKGNTQAKTILYALNHLPTFISATQLGITIASISLGWLGEPTLAYFFSNIFPFLIPSHSFLIYTHIAAVAFSLLFITFVEIIFGELAPKTTALQNPEKIAFLTIIPLTIFTTIFRPFIWLLEKTSSSFLGLFHISGFDKKKSIHSEEEIKMILAQSAQGGAIDQHEADIIYHVFQIGDLPVQNIMTPLAQVVAFDEMETIKNIAREITEENIHTRFPIYDHTKKHIVGYVSVMDIYELALELQGDKPLAQTKLIRKTITIDKQTRVDDVLMLMKSRNIHLGIVTEKVTRAVGIVSIEDIIESFIGKIREDQIISPLSR